MIKQVTVYDNIIFIEGSIPTIQTQGKITYSSGGLKIGSQLKTLNHVKKTMAKKARRQKANAIVGFTYGQKHSILSGDSIKCFGLGYAATIPSQMLEQLHIQYRL